MAERRKQWLERGAIEAEQVRAYFEEHHAQNLSGALVFTLLIFVLHEQAPWELWLPALGVVYAVTMTRAYLLRKFKHTSKAVNPAKWALAHVACATFSGAAWGISSAMMLPLVPVTLQLFILTVCSVSAAATSESISNVWPSRVFVLTCLVPIVLSLLTMHDRLHGVLALMLVILILMTFWQGTKRHRLFMQTLHLRFQNEFLAKELSFQRDAVEQASLSKLRFFASASHDMRQPLQALSIFHELLTPELKSSAQGKTILDRAKQTARSMGEMLEAFLDISKLDSNVVQPNLRPFIVGDLLVELEREFLTQAEQKGLQFSVVYSSAIINTDPVLLARILRNLLANAIRYTPSGRVLLGCRRRENALDICVYDTGIGIAEEHQDLIFSEFYQVGNRGKDRNIGFGLGLAIVSRLARIAGHHIALRSRLGTGSCFMVSIPRAYCAPAEESVFAGMDGTILKTGLRGLLVALIEDEELLRNSMQSVLQGWGCDVVAAASVEEALQCLDALGRAPDFVISDFHLLDNADGIGAITVMRQRYGQTLPGMIVTGDTSISALMAAQKARLRLLNKPIPPLVLQSAILEVMGERAGS